jgi:hypothetical protein
MCEYAKPRVADLKLVMVSKGGYHDCGHCGGLVVSSSEWVGEDADGQGWFTRYHTCEDCGRHAQESVKE